MEEKDKIILDALNLILYKLGYPPNNPIREKIVKLLNPKKEKYSEVKETLKEPFEKKARKTQKRFNKVNSRDFPTS